MALASSLQSKQVGKASSFVSGSRAARALHCENSNKSNNEIVVIILIINSNNSSNNIFEIPVPSALSLQSLRWKFEVPIPRVHASTSTMVCLCSK